MSKNKHMNYSSKPTGNSTKPLVIITLTVIVLLIALFIFSNMASNKNQPSTVFQEPPSLVNQPVLGNDDAPVTLIEFGDYKCPSCKAWSNVVYPQLQKEYIDTGKLKFAYINVLFHEQESVLAALAGEAVFAQDPQAFWMFHKALYEAQPQANHDGLWITEEKILEVVKTAAPTIDLTKLKEDLKNQEVASRVKIDNELVQKFGVKQTPTVMINGTVLENPFDINMIKELIDKEIGDKQ